MAWAEKIIGLPAWIVSATYVLLFGVSAALADIVPITSGFVAMSLAALLCNGGILYWLHALHAVARSRAPISPAQTSNERGIFVSALVWTTIWCVVAPLLPLLQPFHFMLLLAPITLAAGYFLLRAAWAAASALMAFERSGRVFQTFLAVLYFPIGIWFLQRRLHSLIAAQSQAAPSPA